MFYYIHKSVKIFLSADQIFTVISHAVAYTRQDDFQNRDKVYYTCQLPISTASQLINLWIVFLL